MKPTKGHADRPSGREGAAREGGGVALHWRRVRRQEKERGRERARERGLRERMQLLKRVWRIRRGKKIRLPLFDCRERRPDIIQVPNGAKRQRQSDGHLLSVWQPRPRWFLSGSSMVKKKFEVIPRAVGQRVQGQSRFVRRLQWRRGGGLPFSSSSSSSIMHHTTHTAAAHSGG